MRVVATDLLPTRGSELAREFGAARGGLPRDEGRVEVQSPKSKAQSPASRITHPASASRITDHVSRITRPPAAPRLSALVHQVPRAGLDAAVIAVPSDAVVREAQGLVRGGGQVLVFSHTRRGDETTVDLATVCVDEKDLIGSYSADFRLQAEVARLVFSRKLDARRLVHHQFPLAQTAAATELASQPTSQSLKIVVVQKLGSEVRIPVQVDPLHLILARVEAGLAAEHVHVRLHRGAGRGSGESPEEDQLTGQRQHDRRAGIPAPNGTVHPGMTRADEAPLQRHEEPACG